MTPARKLSSHELSKYQLSDVHSSSATRSRLGSDASSDFMGSGEDPALCNGTMNCGWTAICCAAVAEVGPVPPAAVPWDAAATATDWGSDDAGALPCCEPSTFNCMTDAEDDEAVLDAMPSHVSIGITTCLQTPPKHSQLNTILWYKYPTTDQDLSKTHMHIHTLTYFDFLFNWPVITHHAKFPHLPMDNDTYLMVFSRTTRVSWYQNVSILDYISAGMVQSSLTSHLTQNRSFQTRGRGGAEQWCAPLIQ